MRVLALLLAGGCAKHTYVPPVPTMIPDDVPIPREGGPLAGPHAVVDQAPPRELPPDTPGGGALPPWLAQLRALVNPLLDACLSTGPATITTGTALLTARIDGEGAVLDVKLVRSSGSEAYDRCLVEAFQQARPKPPPPEALTPDRQLVTPEMAFR